MTWCSEQIDKIAPAFLEAQKVIKGATKDSKNPHLKNKYADLGSVFEACKSALNDNGISVLQPMGNKDGCNTMQTVLLHESGQFFFAEALLPSIDQKGINAAQAMGSAISYMKRYELQSITGVISEDDDGHAAGQKSSDTSNASEPTKDVAYWKAQADKNTNHVKNIKAWYKKHEHEIKGKSLTVTEQNEVILHVKVIVERLEKELADKKAAEGASGGDKIYLTADQICEKISTVKHTANLTQIWKEYAADMHSDRMSELDRQRCTDTYHLKTDELRGTQDTPEEITEIEPY